MKVTLDLNRDIRTLKPDPGGDEWWHFNAISEDGQYRFAVTFYEGNPFSTRYIKALEDVGKNPMPQEYPALSISIYEGATPIYYSFTEFDPADCDFNKNNPEIKIGPHRMTSQIGDRMIYKP